MKVTKEQLKQIIREETNNISEKMPRRKQQSGERPSSMTQKSGFQGYTTGKLADDPRYDSPYAAANFTPETTPGTELPKVFQALLKNENSALSQFLSKEESTITLADLESMNNMLIQIFERYGKETGGIPQRMVHLGDHERPEKYEMADRLAGIQNFVTEMTKTLEEVAAFREDLSTFASE